MTKEWLIRVVLPVVGRRLAVAALGALIGLLGDAALLDGQLVDALQVLLAP